ncbi:MAG: hypothetical protein ACRBF0_01440 [Calditrichia bacterium]
MSLSMRSILRSIASILVGYFILAVSNMTFVVMNYVQPVFNWDPAIKIIASIPFNLLFSLLGGYVATRIAGHSETKHAVVLATIMALVTTISIIIAVSVEPTSYKMVYLLTMVPATIWGGILRERQKDGYPH